MKDKVRILTCCCHYDDIVKFDYLIDDILSKKLIEYYQDFIFGIDDSDNNLLIIKKLDEAMYKYVDDFHFAKALKETLDIEQVTSDHFKYLGDLMKYIIQFFESYDDKAVVMTPTRWI